jgi:AbrB family looped-hinge helix DNA binding protein
LFQRGKWENIDKMDQNTDNFALTEALHEIKNADKEISKAFLFKKGKILVYDENEKEENGNQIAEAFEEISHRASIIDGIQALTIQGAKGRVDITLINDYFLTTIASKEATDETINKLTRVLAPSVFNKPEKTVELEKQPELIPQIRLERKPAVEIKPVLSSVQSHRVEPNFANSEFAEFTVENMGRLDVISASKDIVRLDPIIIGRWTELYGINKIHKIIVRVPNTGKSIECKFEEVKEPKEEQRSLALIPEMMQRNLQIKKGAKVLIKPLTDDESPKQALENTMKKQPEKKIYKKPFLPDSIACQLIVEDLSSFGSFMSNDIVRFDYSLIQRWKEFYNDGEVEEVIINDVLLGKSVRCKFKILKDSKFEGKGRIQIPKSIRQELGIKEGSLVTVKPVVKFREK